MSAVLTGKNRLETAKLDQIAVDFPGNLGFLH
jgi:hypothetical protein